MLCCRAVVLQQSAALDSWDRCYPDEEAPGTSRHPWSFREERRNKCETLRAHEQALEAILTRCPLVSTLSSCCCRQ